uniref:Steroid sulfatase (microsomal), isozyme S n=1 Tax=Eptatretus burgeri TaxID=7764 RepID=A0A8C4N4R1_EPTBU
MGKESLGSALILGLPKMLLHVFCILLAMLVQVTSQVASRPNYVLFLADDLGIGDVGCYGNDTLRTPAIDHLAAEGVLLTQHIAAASVCTPSRAAFLTGRYPIRYGMTSTTRLRLFLFAASSGGLPLGEITFAKLLKNHGYATGMIGKWHLGMNCEKANDHCYHPLNHGFDYFYGIPLNNLRDCHIGKGSVFTAGSKQNINNAAPYALGLFFTLLATWLCGVLPIHSRKLLLPTLTLCALLGLLMLFFSQFRNWNCILMENNEIIQQPINFENLTQRIVYQAIRFIERNNDGPFLLYVPFAHVHTAHFAANAFRGSSKHGVYGDSVHELDWAVGEIVNALDRLHLSQNTLVYFSSDQGGHLEEMSPTGAVFGGNNGIYKGGKGMGGFEGGIRVPAILRWPEMLPASRKVDSATSNMDIFSTILTLAGIPLPQDRIIDGKDIFPLLQGETNESQHEFLFHYCSSYLNAVRWSPPNSKSLWKVIYFSPIFQPAGSNACHDTHLCHCFGDFVEQHEPPLVFDLIQDPEECHPLESKDFLTQQRVLDAVSKAVEKHQQSLFPVPSQLSVNNILWKPWLQMCCGALPYCTCDQDKTPPWEGRVL